MSLAPPQNFNTFFNPSFEQLNWKVESNVSVDELSDRYVVTVSGGANRPFTLDPRPASNELIIRADDILSNNTVLFEHKVTFDDLIGESRNGDLVIEVPKR